MPHWSGVPEGHAGLVDEWWVVAGIPPGARYDEISFATSRGEAWDCAAAIADAGWSHVRCSGGRRRQNVPYRRPWHAAAPGLA